MRGLIGGAVVVLGLLFASPAMAAFPGSNGLLAVQPASGGGILLVNANGHVVRRICTAKKVCGTQGTQGTRSAPRRPRWSPDGRAIVFAGPSVTIVYTDGSCMNCQFGLATDPVFTPRGTVISFIQRHRHVSLDGIDGLREPAPALGSVSDAVWSADGKVAVVRDASLWVGWSRRLRRIAPGTDPSWAPSGDRIVMAQGGWVVVVRLRNGHVQRLARGSAPAFSPDGRLIAFVARDHRLMVVAAGGGHARPVGRIRAVAVDWQPKPRGPHPGCATPPGSTVLASSADAVVTGDRVPAPGSDFQSAPPFAYMGCLRADGRERFLVAIRNPGDGGSVLRSAVLAAPYAGLVGQGEGSHDNQGEGTSLYVFDLRSGMLRSDLGGEAAGCPSVDCSGLDQVILRSDGVSAADARSMLGGGYVAHGLAQIACAPASTVCAGVDTWGNIFTSSDPSKGSPSWSEGVITPASGPGPDTIACPSQSLCVGAAINIYTSSDPGSPASTWTAAKPTGTQFPASAISCPTISLCVVSRGDGSIVTSMDPTGGGSAWSTAMIDAGHQLGPVICSTEPRCFLSAGDGKVFTSTDPTGGPTAWKISTTTPRFTAGACPTTTLCVISDRQGRLDVTTDPSAERWIYGQQSFAGFTSIACPSASLCLAGPDLSGFEFSTDPASDEWSKETMDQNNILRSIACSSDSFCAASDAVGEVLSSTDPGGGPWFSGGVVESDPCGAAQWCNLEQIEVTDGSGMHTVDQAFVPLGTPFLTGLTFQGDTLSWSHGGTTVSVDLTPTR